MTQIQKVPIKVQLTNEVRGYLGSKDPRSRVVTINLKYRSPSCTSPFCKLIPYVETKLVETSGSPDQYVQLDSSNGVTVYLSNALLPGIEPEQEIVIQLRGRWIFKKLDIRGINLDRI